MDFYTSVRLWKLANAGLWSGFFNLVLSFVTCKLTGDEFRLFTYLIGVLFHFLLLFAHSMTLSIIPIRIADLELEDALMRLEWFVLHLVFLTVTAFTWYPIRTDPMTTRTAATLACLVTFIISRHEKFAVYINLRKTPRSAKIFEIFWSFVLTILTYIFVFLAV
jgi:ABC-type branched-subunit amino acid transport system permease subunit